MRMYRATAATRSIPLFQHGLAVIGSLVFAARSHAPTITAKQ
jgi:hypothetical protein